MLDISKKEEEILRYWRENKINEKVKAKNKNAGKPFYFLDGPPFVTGELHLGQVWTKSFKDLVVRYKRYRGFDVIDRAGYDSQGLPAENLIEKKLKLTSKKDIEDKIGIENFIKACRDEVNYYIGKWENEFERFGVSLDFSDPYLPHSNQYMEGEWALFKTISDRGYLYSGSKTTAYCPHCECVVSQGSMEVEHYDEKDPSIFITFKIDLARSKSSRKTHLGANITKEAYLLVWTTTPWTLPANVAVAIDPNALYVLAKLRDKEVILAKSRMEQVFALLDESAVVLKEFYGSEIEGAYYISGLEKKVPEQASLRKHHKVIAAPNLVSGEEGTGLVHIAPGHGLDDYILGVKSKLPIFCPVGSDAAYTEAAGDYKGLKVPDAANVQVLKDIKEIGMLEYSGELTHSYPHCWRCHSKVIFIATPQWFFNVQKIKKKLLKVNEKISWQPAEAKAWEKDLITNSPDWCISRQRYWATPMPIWVCEKCGNADIIGSRKELEERSTDPGYVRSMADLHRPFIDKVIIKCSKCGGESRRIKDVIDVWFDSGMSFRLALSEEQFDNLFPVDFIVEYVEQIRAWFQALLKCGMFAYGKGTVKSIAVHGILWGTDGKKMSKSLGNYRPINDMLNYAGADAFRFWMLNHSQIDNRSENDEEIKDNQKVILLLHNIANLLKEYSGAIGYSPKRTGRLGKGLENEEAWLASRYASTMRSVTDGLDAYDPGAAAGAIKNFIVEDLSRFYLKIAKKKILYGSRKSAKSCIDTINYVLFNTLIAIAPFMPFVAESVYLENYKTKESVLLEDWPRLKKGMADETLEKEFAVAQESITAILNSREKANIKLRWPISSAVIEVNDNGVESSLLKLSTTIAEYANAKTVSVKRVEAFGKEIRPAFTKIGPEFKQDAQVIAEALKKEDPDKLSEAIAKSGYYPLDTERGMFSIKPEHFTIVEKVEGENAIKFRYGVARIDAKVSDELMEEAMVKEFERRVQLARKEKALSKGDRINLSYEASAPFAEIIKKNSDKIKKDVGARTMREGLGKESIAKEEEIEEERLRIEIEKAI